MRIKSKKNQKTKKKKSEGKKKVVNIIFISFNNGYCGRPVSKERDKC